MLAEVILFIPSAATFRQNWLLQRVSSAQQLTLAVMGVPDFQGSELLSSTFMEDTDVIAVMQKKQGMTESVLGMAPADGVYTKVDMRAPKTIPDIGATLRAYFGDGEGYLRVWGEPSVPGAQMLEIIIPNAAVKKALENYCHRVIGLSFLIAIFTGLLIYLTLSWLIVRPMQRLAQSITAFRENPQQPVAFTVSKRKDEIGALQHEFEVMTSDIRGALKQKDRLATLGLAVAKINHDLRNVLSTAQLISDRLASDSEERIRRMGERLVRAVDRGVQLCSATLTYSKSSESTPERQPVRLASLLGEAAGDAISSYKTDNKRHVKINWINTVPSDMTVSVDLDQTYRIFNNLFRNAVQALARHDTAKLPSLRVEALSVKTDEGNDILVRVIDNGPGLSGAAQANLFKPFTGTSIGGTGLGLTISRELATGHGGDIRLESTGEAGTIFVVVLPQS